MKLVLEETVNAPQTETFQVFSDLRNAASRIDSIQSLELLSNGPVGKGTRFRETRVMFGKEATEEMEITAFDPPNSYAVEGDSCGAHFHTVYTFAGNSQQTKVTMTMTSTAHTFFAKVMGPVMGVLMGPAMKKAMRQDHAQLKAAAESVAASAAGDASS